MSYSCSPNCLSFNPVIAGSAVRGAGAYESFRKFVERIHIPTVAATAVSDLFPVSAEDYYGNFGVIGGRAGNHAAQGKLTQFFAL